MKMENIDFGEALAMLADRANITLTPRRAVAAVTRADERRLRRQSRRQTHALSSRRVGGAAIRRCLLSDPEGESARRYLDNRGVNDESIRRYHLGFSPDRWDWLIKQALKKRILAGGAGKSWAVDSRDDGGGHYDRFRGRVIFSIRDVQGRPVAIGGRVLPENAAANPAKYVNSPETPLFSKSRMLYGLDLARDAITQKQTAGRDGRLHRLHHRPAVWL